MIYRHNSIFKNPSCVLSKYIHDMQLNVTCSGDLRSSRVVPEVTIKMTNVALSTAEFTANITIYLDGIEIFAEAVSKTGISPGSMNSIMTKSGITILMTTPLNGALSIDEELLQPYVAVLSPSVTVGSCTVEFPESMVNVDVTQDEVYLSILDGSIPTVETSAKGFTHINGICPGTLGNIDIKSKNPDISITVRSVG